MIDKTAIVNSKAKLHKNVQVGPFCVIGPEVVIEDNVKLLSNVVVQGKTTICSGTKVWPFTVLGGDPQDLKFKGENGSLKIGKNNNIREHVTMHIGTEAGGLETKVGENNLFMAGAHVAHDCDIGNNCVLANNVMIAGHVQIGDWAILGGLSGNRATLEGLNLTGLRRRNFNNEEIKKAKRAYSVLFENDENEFNDRIEKLKSENIKSSVVEELISFITQKGSRSYCLPQES